MMWNVLRRWHRSLAMIAAIPVLAWTLTGLLHPVMSRWQPSAVIMKPPAEMLAPPSGMVWRDLPAPARLLPATLSLRELRALTWQQKPYWMAQTTAGERLYFDARTGQPAEIEQALVTALARHYTGAQTPVRSISLVVAFDHEYAFVNRYLPVWRVAFDQSDGLVAFIEPRSLLLAALTDTWKTRFSLLFTNLHSWAWWPHEPSRDVAMTAILSAAWLLVASGLLRARMSRYVSVASGPRRWHRRIGWLVAAAALAWLSSAIFHVLAIDKGHPAFSTYPLRASFTPTEVMQPAPMAVPLPARLQVLATPGGPLWYWQFLQLAGQTAGTEHQHHAAANEIPVLHEAYVSAKSGETIQPLLHMRALSAAISANAPLLSSESITKFGSEYGFVQKRLPVYRLVFNSADHLSVYIDPADAAVAAVVRDLDRAEGFSFAYLHKASWLDFLGKNARDAVLACFALMIFALTLVGLYFLRKKQVVTR
ncbi:MAG: hypothetical protein V4624_08435 [Pseudomonadota bacterium]